MKLLLCSPVVGVSKSNPGGIAVWEQNIYEYYQKNPNGMHIHVQSCDRMQYINENTGKIKRVWYGIKDYNRIIKEIKTQLNRENHDAIHMCTTASLSLIKDYLVFKIAKKKRVQTILHFHFGRIPNILKDNTWETKLLKKALSVTDKIIVIDQFSYDALTNEGYSNVFYVPNPLASSVVTEIENNKNIERIKRRVLFAGRVFRKKGIYELVAACLKVPNIELRIVGHTDSSDKQALLNLANNGSWLNFTGPIPHEDVMKEMLASDIFILPTYTEGFPNAIIECMACGTPIITTPVGAIPEMLDINGNACGICVPPKNVDSLSNAIISLINDEAKKTEFSIRSKKRVEEVYSIESVWNSLCAVWKK